MNITKKKKFQKRIFTWYKKNGRHDLPWRKTKDLYAITVSEIMLQQTNVPKVIEKYHAFLKKFPSWKALSRAQRATVLKQWQGLGYNRRALYLHDMAKRIVKDHSGKMPEDAEKLTQFSGMGPYTRNAVLIFGRNTQLSAKDVNIERVVRRWMGIKKINSTKTKEKIEKEIVAFVPKGRSRDWHNALMDFASSVCTKRKPACTSCPLQKGCLSFPDPKDYFLTKKKEPGREENGKHIPRRIFRGRVVEALRSSSHSLVTLGKRIKEDWDTKNDRVWLLEILLQLEKEQMIEQKNKKWQLKR